MVVTASVIKSLRNVTSSLPNDGIHLTYVEIVNCVFNFWIPISINGTLKFSSTPVLNLYKFISEITLITGLGSRLSLTTPFRAFSLCALGNEMATRINSLIISVVILPIRSVMVI